MIEDAGREFQGGPEQALVAIAKSQLALAKGEVDAALTLLRHDSRDTLNLDSLVWSTQCSAQHLC